jgi:hypothetical protein
MSDKINPIPDFRGPSALDLLSAFTKRYGKIIQDADQESGYRDASFYFEPELHRLIQAFVREAVEPMQKALTELMMRTQFGTIPPPMFKEFDAGTQTAMGAILSGALRASDVRGDAGFYMGRKRTPEEVEKAKQTDPSIVGAPRP